ncbi:MAG: GNAT family N-acetyltransferase [Polyangiaceae bacterium]
MTIRNATPADVPAIHSLIIELARYEHLEDQVRSTEARLGEHLFGPRPYAEALVAEDAGKTVGFALFFHNYSTFLGQPGMYLEDLFVLPEQRRKGQGRALFGRVARVAVERGCGRLEWAVLDWNRPAIDFYESLGAQRLDEWGTFRLTGPGIARVAGE